MYPQNKNFWLSTFYPVSIIIMLANGKRVVANCVESAFQALRSPDNKEREAIANMPPRKAQEYARRRDLPHRADRIEIMRKLLKQKFRSNGLKDSLLRTPDEHLVIHNQWHDNYWGNCTCDDCSNKPKHNNMGKLLVELKHSLMEQSLKPIVDTAPETNDLQQLQAEGTNSVAPEPTPVTKPKRVRKPKAKKEAK